MTTNFDEDPPLSAEARLVNSILEHYSRYGKVNRPVIDSSHPVRVQFGLRLIQVDLNESEQTMTTSVWIRLVRIIALLESGLCHSISLRQRTHTML